MTKVTFDSKAFDKAIMDAIIKQVQEKVKKAVGVGNASKITIKINGRDLKHLSMEVSGPEELIEKVKKALQ